jgi:hypothetical protein
VQTQLYQAFSLEMLYRHEQRQVTPSTLAAIINDSDNPTPPANL